jgi:hypothetical protein
MRKLSERSATVIGGAAVAVLAGGTIACAAVTGSGTAAGKRDTESFARAGAAILGGSIHAYAPGSGPPAVVRVSAASVRDGPRPTAAAHGHRVDLRWAHTEISPGVPSERYLVRRHGAGTPVIVCTARATSCQDTDVPAGEWRYTVVLLLHTWEGGDGPASAPVTVTSTVDTPGGAAAATGPSAPTTLRRR